MKVLVFGAGENGKQFLRCSPVAGKVEIAGVVDNNRSRWGTEFEQKYVIESPQVIASKEWDKIAITSHLYFWEIRGQLIREYKVEEDRIIRASDLIVPGQSNMGSVRLDCDYDSCYEVSELIPDRVIPGNKMEEFYLKGHHRLMNKWWHYFEVYETFFNRYVGSDVKILEIGVFRGGSMQMWKDYFGEKATIVGLDIDANCKAFEEGNVHICIGSQADKEFLVSVSEKWGPFDIVLDDGSHEMDHQIITFETLFPLLKEGGVYMCEDCLSSYSPRYGGEYRKKDTFIEYSKNFIDCLNSQYVNLEKADTLPFYRDYIKACHFYDSVVVVEKKRRGYSVVTEFER